MKQKLLAAVGLAALLGAPLGAHAQDSGFYVRGQAGYGAHTDIDITGDIVGEVESEGNGTASLGAGYEFGNGFRLELDVASLWTDLGRIDSFPGTYAKLRTTTGMINALYDFNNFGAFQPYVGAGVGIVRGDAQVVANNFLADPNVGPEVNNPVLVGQSVGASFDDGDTGLGWQLLAGLGYAITDNLTWDTSYRYMQSNDLDFDGTIAPVAGSLAAGQIELEDVGAHSLMTGFRYRFGDSAPKTKICPTGVVIPVDDVCPPPPPEYKTCPDGSRVLVTDECPVVVEYKTCPDGSRVEVGMECPAPTLRCPDGTMVFDLAQCPNIRTELPECDRNVTEVIYYEFDRGQSPETQATINRILDRADFCDVDNFLVVGHTDTSGSAAYNLALSRRRAADARRELIRQGVPENIIRSEGRGESQPAVATGDGVREQLNRRTEVVMTLATQGLDVERFRVAPGMTSSTTTTTTTMTSTSGEIFTDTEGRRMRMDANGNFVYIDN